MLHGTFKTAPHNPPHFFVANALYMLTASICKSVPLMESTQRKAEWRDAFFEAAKIYQWTVIAWVVLQNHCHVIVQSPLHVPDLSAFIGSYDKFTARKWNDADGLKGRQVWWNYWDTCIRSEKDYYNRLRYVFWNLVKHGLADRPKDYPFSNYSEYMNQLQSFDLKELNEVNDVPEF